MAPVIPNPDNIRAFATQQSFETWLKKNHSTASELWLKIHKKDSGLKTVTYAEALDAALCWGWIDGIKKTFDDQSFLQRFTPRRARSIWSQKNREHVERLTREGRMTPHGQVQVDAAKEDGRWANAYGGASSLPLPAELLDAVAKDPRAQATLDSLNKQNRYALSFRIHNLKTEEGRKKKITAFVEMLKRGETIYPNGKSAKAD